MEYYKLTNETIDMLSDKISEMYESAECSKKDTLRAKLLLEEALIKYQQHLGTDVDLYFRSYKIFGQFRFSVRLRAPAFDPFSLEENPMAFMIQNIMSGFENTMPTWKYKNLENEIVFTAHKKASIGNISRIFISILTALVLGVISRLVIPQEILSAFVTNYLAPLSDAYAGLFCVMAVLLTFLAIALSIIHIGDMASVGALGGRIMRRYILVCAAIAAVMTLPILPFFDLSGAGTYTVAAKSIYDILIGFIPTNFVRPFLDFNSVHIMLIGAMFGFALLAMGQRGGTLVEAFDECNLVAVYTNGFLNKFLFIYVGMKLFGIITTSQFSQLAGAGKMVVTIVAAEILLLLFYTIRTCAKTKMSLQSYIKAMMPPFAVCLSSGNFGAAFNLVFESVSAGGVDADTANLSLNLGSIFFQPACTVVFVFSSVFLAQAYGVEISAVWVIMAVLLSVILVGTMPNIPGASVSVITLLYAQLGIPVEALSIMIAINAILQFLTTSVDVWCLISEVLCMNAGQKKTAG